MESRDGPLSDMAIFPYDAAPLPEAAVRALCEAKFDARARCAGDLLGREPAGEPDAGDGEGCPGGALDEFTSFHDGSMLHTSTRARRPGCVHQSARNAIPAVVSRRPRT